ncbi:peptidoglycan editing factor PgeF [Marinobacter sp. OP 3.4]|uniref:peptidoglycan editing factor PgeF n=1 Tax=Marinobacter sp. OP 3.4 TaxID=3076501 RepID=UPI002E2514A5
MSSELPLIHPDWPAPSRVRALCTTRSGGASSPPWDSFNLGDHVGDNHGDVLENRRRLAHWAHLETEDFHWLQQVHGIDVARLPGENLLADAAVTDQPGVVCTILTADCLPVLFCNREGTRVAAAHAGWRGLADGVLENTVAEFDQPSQVLAWLGPAIGPERFEVGPEVRERFLAFSRQLDPCFALSPDRPGHFLADIVGLARFRLQQAGVEAIHGGDWCTVSEPQRFFSYRRDGQTGRMASCIWLEP